MTKCKPLFKDKNSVTRIEPKKLFLKVPMKDMTKFKLDKVRDSRFYKSFVQNFNELDDYSMREEEDALRYLINLHNDIINEFLPRIEDGGLYVLLTGMLDTIKAIFDMCKDYRNIHRIKVANFSMRFLLEDSYRYYFNHKCTYNIWKKGNIPDEWYEHIGKYNAGAHCNYTKLVYSVKEIKDDMDFCIDKIIERRNKVY